MYKQREKLLEKLLEEDTRREFIKQLTEHDDLKFKRLYEHYLKISETNARYHLDILREAGIVERFKKKGEKSIYLRISPTYLERIRFFFGITKPYCYAGLVGQKNPSKQLKNSILRLEKNSFSIKAICIFSSKENITTLEEDQKFLILKESINDVWLDSIPLFDFQTVYKTIKERLMQIVTNYSIVADVTGSTKIHTLALYILASDFGFKKVYLPEEGDQIIYLP